MHPAWFRIGGVAHDLPNGWDKLVREFIDWMPKRLDEYEKMALQNTILKKRSHRHRPRTTPRKRIEWGVTGPGLRATGCDWDLRKARPYSGYENFEFDVPTGQQRRRLRPLRGARRGNPPALRIIEQCLKQHAGRRRTRRDHPLTTPPLKEHTLQDIETLITHFLQRVVGPGDSGRRVLDDGRGDQGPQQLLPDQRRRHHELPHAHPHAELPAPAADPFGHRNGMMVPDLIAYIASIDFVMADVDR